MIMIIIITIKRNKARCDFLCQRLDNLGLKYQVIEGYDSQEMLDSDFEKINTDFYYNLYGIRMSRSEIACALSHRKVYEVMISQNIERALILEDDAFPLSSAPEILNKLSTSNFGDLIYLYHGKAKKLPIYRNLPQGYRLHRYLKPSSHSRRSVIYSVAYVINVKSARRLLEVGSVRMMPADFLIGLLQLHYLKTYGVEPCCFDHGYFPSSIYDRK